MSERDNLDLGDDDGYIDVTVGGTTLKVDLWQAKDQLVAAHDRYKDAPPDQYNDALAGVIEALGFPRPSHRLAQRFALAVLDAAAKKNGPSSPSAG